ncbi:MAG TPA: prepilin-type N-terminal cleavage/methylation domain-containing protein [Thermoanaerobaculia bacterium]|jgi:type II secretory pathway pseudopilin PulG|nr:prepilin-type N-terminal cleavage/methylation domain-containing protein [Thermoanaerobaculia bacterium]
MDMVLRPTARRSEAGLTLIEVLVAATVLALALLGLAPMFTSAVRSNASAYQLTNSTTLAREKLEELSGYPRSDTRLTIAAGKNAAGPTGTTITGAIVGVCDSVPGAVPARTYCDNDLPTWINPQTGATSSAPSRPGIAWFSYPFTRTYTIEQFDGTLVTRVTAPAPYVVKLITVTVRPTSGPFPGLRESRQSLYLRIRDA